MVAIQQLHVIGTEISIHSCVEWHVGEHAYMTHVEYVSTLLTDAHTSNIYTIPLSVFCNLCLYCHVLWILLILYFLHYKSHPFMPRTRKLIILWESFDPIRALQYHELSKIYEFLSQIFYITWYMCVFHFVYTLGNSLSYSLLRGNPRVLLQDANLDMSRNSATAFFACSCGWEVCTAFPHGFMGTRYWYPMVLHYLHAIWVESFNQWFRLGAYSSLVLDCF